MRIHIIYAIHSSNLSRSVSQKLIMVMGTFFILGRKTQKSC